MKRDANPSPVCWPHSHPAKENQENLQALVKEAAEEAQNDNTDPRMNQGPGDMGDREDASSEYDNVGSDIEQDYDEVLHLNRDGMVDLRYCRQSSPEDGGFLKQSAGDGATDRTLHTSPLSHTQPYEVDPHCTSYRAQGSRDEPEGGRQRFFLSGRDEEVLDGATFVEGLEDDESIVQRQTSLHQDKKNEPMKAGEVEPQRSQNIPAAVGKNEVIPIGSKDREGRGKGRRRRGTGDDLRNVSAIKGLSSDQHPKSVSVRSSEQPDQETTPAPRTSTRTSPPETKPRAAVQSVAPEQTKQRRTQRSPQVSNPVTLLITSQLLVLFCCPVPGPCEPEDLIDGIIFATNYLGCTQVLSDKNPSKSVRMSQAQEAVSRIKSQDESSQMMTEVDLFISTKAVKVLNADTQETMMDSALRTISYIADIGSIVVLMARRRVSPASSDEFSESFDSAGKGKSQYGMICYVFESEDAQLITQSIGQAFSVAYREFLRANGINPTDLSQKQFSDIIDSQEMYHDDLIHFSNSDNCKELYVEKQKGEVLGVVIVESGWGSILPTVILAGMQNNGAAARSGKLRVGDQVMSINDTSLVGLPLATCQSIIKGLKNQLKVKMSIVSCPPVTTVLIKRPDLKFQLGFSIQNGIICSLMRGGIAERGGVRVGHRIIEINGQSVVAMAHEKIVQTLSVSVGEINMKTMPAVMFRLLTGQDMPVYI
uniref:Amyloid-beta A4 precursor protein-binding family A member 3 n=1 Tax=Gouania willdenowi TaxID=441366 RepID=A0A8C5N305_GOUWI